MELALGIDAEVLQADQHVALAEEPAAVGPKAVPRRLPDDQRAHEVGDAALEPLVLARGKDVPRDRARRPELAAGPRLEERVGVRVAGRVAAAAAEEHRPRNRARIADDVDQGRLGIDAVKVGHLAKEADLLDQDVRRLLQEVGEEVDAPGGQAPGWSSSAGALRPAVVEELERDSRVLVALELAPDLARLGEQVLGARARAAAGRLGVLAERLVEALEVRVLAERVVEDRRPRAAHPLDEDVHAGDATCCAAATKSRGR